MRMMTFSFELKESQLKSYEEFVYNLTLVAPGKGDAKKSVSKGLIRLGFAPFYKGVGPHLNGMATDDILSVFTETPLYSFEGEPTNEIPGGTFQPHWVTVEGLRAATPTPIQGLNFGAAPVYRVTLDTSPDFDAKFDRLFWVEHTLDSISGYWDRPSRLGDDWDQIKISPDRLRKFSLLKPQGHPILWEFGEWADRDIIRWTYDSMSGVYVPLD